MKGRNKYNVVIELDNIDERVGLLVYLHTIGYNVVNIDNLYGLYHIAKLNTHIILDDWVVNNISHHGSNEEWIKDLNENIGKMGYYDNITFLATNIEQFKAIANISDENDNRQWFRVKSNERDEWYICQKDDYKIHFNAWLDKFEITKATVDEIIKHFK